MGHDAVEFDFDRIIDRNNTNALATDGFRKFLLDGAEDLVLPVPDNELQSMWVADMAFATAPAAIEAMHERIDHPIFGYSANIDDELFDAFAAWCDRYYGWVPERAHFLTSPGVVPALFDLVEFVLGPGQKVLTLTPAYAPFDWAAVHHDRTLVTCELVESEDGQYTIDFADFEELVADPELGMFFLCHPHNPTGRVWSDDELRRMAELCFEHDVMVVSDEIHCDLLRTGLAHTPLAKLFPGSDQIITCMSSSKTFNLAGLGIAYVVIPNDEIRRTWIDRNFPIVNPISMAAATGVLRNGHTWLEELRTYVDANFELVRQTLGAQLPDAVFGVPDATYLAWIDLRECVPPGLNLTRFFAERAGVLLEGSDKFVSEAEGDAHIRLNLACPRSVLEEALARIVAATLER